MKKALSTFILFITYIYAFATHERAGEITYRNIDNNPLKYEFTILTFTYSQSPANRDRLVIDWGDNTSDTILLSNREIVGSDMFKNTYVGQKTYSGPGTFVVSFEDPNRNAGIINIDNSVNIPFYTETLLTIDPLGSINNSPILLNPPIDVGCVQNLFLHNPGAYDVDGDSLSYRLTTCKGAGGNDIASYRFPDDEDHFFMNPVTGTLTWDSPTIQGEYNVAFIIEEWRNGYKIGSVTRDMQIKITYCDNTPPKIENLNDTCILAGTYLEFDVNATDTEHVISLSAAGGPFVVDESAAEFENILGNSPLTQQFRWQTVCKHVRKQAYDLSFTARDTLNNINLSTIETVKITVIGPPPENPDAYASGRNIFLSWDSYECENINNFHIFRKKGSSDHEPTPCETGLPNELGYTLIGSVSASITSFMDDNNSLGLDNGHLYCYRIVAEFENGALSQASEEACTQLRDDIPVLTNASVLASSNENGSIYLSWSKPNDIAEIYGDGPFRYTLYEVSNGESRQLKQTQDLNDTSFNHIEINTIDEQHRYFVSFEAFKNDVWEKIGDSRSVVSPYLKVSPTDNKNLLSINAEPVSWINDSIKIFRKTANDSDFILIDSTAGLNYIDSNLSNGVEYCYKIETGGYFTAEELPSRTYNFSQEACGIPKDNIPPCQPQLRVETDCDENENHLTWNDLNQSCADDVLKYYIHYSPSPDQEYTIIDSISSTESLEYYHTPSDSYLGCYAIQAADSVYNLSPLSDKVCQDHLACPVYTLPNAFTPDGDSENDYFVPTDRSASVQSISIQIFNRYGKIVYETEDPEIRWNGKYKNTENECVEGVYFYVCEINQTTFDGIVKRNLTGSIHLIRRKN